MYVSSLLEIRLSDAIRPWRQGIVKLVVDQATQVKASLEEFEKRSSSMF